jgi:hypothetical protein
VPAIPNETVREQNGPCPVSPAAVALGAVEDVPIARIRPAVSNDIVYGAIADNDTSIDELARSLHAEGQLEPVVLSTDRVLISGHRRRAAALKLGWRTLKARTYAISSEDPDFDKILVQFNAQRDKSPDVRIREQLVLTDPEDAYESLVAEREEAARVKAKGLALPDRRQRSRISDGRMPFLEACLKVIDGLEDYWPVSERQVFYGLLNDPPLIHAKKPGSRFRNDKKSYKAVTTVLTQGRLQNLVSWEAIGDETRPVVTWNVHANVGPFFRKQVDRFGTGYWRDLMQSQPNHIEIVGEKLTIESIIRPVAMKYCIPYTVGRGYSSLPPRKAMFDRFTASGKAKLIILGMTDHDPEGWDIVESFGRSMRDDFGVKGILVVKVGLTREQARELGLPQNADVKKTSSRYKKFVARFGAPVYELEAAPPDRLQQWLDEAVRSVIDVARFNEQVGLEKEDARAVAAFKKAAVEYLKTIRPG